MQCSHGRCNYSTFVFECSLYHSITFFLQIRTQVQNLRKRREKTWEFDEVFSPSQTTSDLFEEVEPLVTSVMDGYNVCIFAYGQTGSGKTYTMEGTKEDPGIYWRALSSLFDVKSRRSNAWDIDIKISILEVYNENIRDLLSDTAGKKEEGKKTLRIKMLRGGENYVEGLSMPTVKSIEQIRNYMNAGKKVRLMTFEHVLSILSLISRGTHTHTHKQ